MEYGNTGGMGGGFSVGAGVGGLGGGALIAALPATGGSLRVVTIAALVSVFTGLVVLLSVLVRSIAMRRYGA